VPSFVNTQYHIRHQAISKGTSVSESTQSKQRQIDSYKHDYDQVDDIYTQSRSWSLFSCLMSWWDNMKCAGAWPSSGGWLALIRDFYDIFQLHVWCALLILDVVSSPSKTYGIGLTDFWYHLRSDRGAATLLRLCQVDAIMITLCQVLDIIVTSSPRIRHLAIGAIGIKCLPLLAFSIPDVIPLPLPINHGILSRSTRLFCSSTLERLFMTCTGEFMWLYFIGRMSQLITCYIYGVYTRSSKPILPGAIRTQWRPDG
jgi:hypothetical protein